eukprot:scaffold2493_cov62-Phaeocystis_antarctica.AAC.10
MVDCLRGQQSSRKDTQRAARLLRLSYDATERNVSTAPEGPPLRTPPSARAALNGGPAAHPKHATPGSLQPILLP